MISFFRAPIKNITPEAQVSILQIYKYITGGYAKLITERLRSMSDPASARRYKGEMLDYVTFSGCFSSRRTGELIEHSGFLCFDIDKIESEKRLQEIKTLLINDEELHTVLCFRSPSGNGLKWVVEVPDRHWLTQCPPSIVGTQRAVSYRPKVEKSNSVHSVYSVRNKNSVSNNNSAGVKSVEIRRATLAQQESEFCNKREQKPNLFGLCRVPTKSRAKRVIEEKEELKSELSVQSVGDEKSRSEKKSVHSVSSVREEKNDVIVKNHRVLYERIRGYLFEQYGIETDHTSDIARPCYLCHDADAYYDEPTFHSNPASRFLKVGTLGSSVRTSKASSNLCKSDERLLTKSKQRIEKELNNQSDLCNLWETKTNKNKKNYENDIEKIVRDIERRRLDITDDYHNWMLVAMALAGTYGSAGEQYFHRISQFHPKYDNAEAHRMYQSCVRNTHGAVGIGTIVFLMNR